MLQVSSLKKVHLVGQIRRVFSMIAPPVEHHPHADKIGFHSNTFSKGPEEMVLPENPANPRVTLSPSSGLFDRCHQGCVGLLDFAFGCVSVLFL